MRDLILQLSKSSIYSTKPLIVLDSSIGSARYFSAGFCSYIPPFLPVMALFPAVSLFKTEKD
ncbi:hypothetical protein CI762_24230 [Klebsiella pneumoniae subsp. pneumoniae]|nr:hypothetical protein CI762_24230 [Klebsiella pneumoniae subsp. pneumoniae]